MEGLKEIKDLLVPKYYSEFMPDGIAGIISLKAHLMDLKIKYKNKPNKKLGEMIRITQSAYDLIYADLKSLYHKDAVISILENRLYLEMQKASQLEQEVKTLQKTLKF